ncbi:MAG: hypothetical protein KAI97_05150 [Gemmatimonadetes bacterium]|nr:hypothetical protein [Gemmatimonadota bacterium]
MSNASHKLQQAVPQSPGSPAWPVVWWLIGIAATSYPTFVSGFRLVQGGLGDTRLVNFTLEYGYRWLMGMPIAASFWSPPIFFPATGVTAYTDLLLGVAPLYWVWRWLGAEPDTAYQCWMLVCWSLNYVAFYLVLRRSLATSVLASAVGAWFFAFASPRMAGVMHQQLVIQFFMVLALAAINEVARLQGSDSRASRTRIWIALFFAAGVLQLNTAVYPLLYFAIGLSVAGAVAAFSRQGRSTIVRVVRTHPITIAVSVALALLAAAPAIMHYRDSATAFGGRPLPPNHLPKLASWFLMGDHNLAWGWLHDLSYLEWANRSLHHNGIGILALVLCSIGLWRGRDRAVVRLMVAAVAVLFVITLRLPGDWSLWEPLRHVIPGGTSARAIARVGMMLLYPAALGLALMVDGILLRRPWWVAFFILAPVVAEQVHRPQTYDKVEAKSRIGAIADVVPQDTDAFLLVTTNGPQDRFAHEDAMWVAITAGVPTINGRYGKRPGKCWQLRDVHAANRRQAAKIRANLDRWIECRELDPVRTTWVEFQARPPEPK